MKIPVHFRNNILLFTGRCSCRKNVPEMPQMVDMIEIF